MFALYSFIGVINSTSIYSILYKTYFSHNAKHIDSYPINKQWKNSVENIDLLLLLFCTRIFQKYFYAIYLQLKFIGLPQPPIIIVFYCSQDKSAEIPNCIAIGLLVYYLKKKKRKIEIISTCIEEIFYIFFITCCPLIYFYCFAYLLQFMNQIIFCVYCGV